MDEQTILPEATDVAVVVDLLKVLRERGREVPESGARLVSADGSSAIDLPASLHAVLVKTLEALANGYAVTIMPHHTTLTSQRASDMLGVSRPTLTKLLDEGEIPFERPNSHRRIKLADLLRYRERRRAERQELLQQLTTEAMELGLYDLPASAYERGDSDQPDPDHLHGDRGL